MTENKQETVNNQQSPSFFSGLVFGMAAGAAAFFLLGTKKGRKVRNQLLKQAKQSWGELEKTAEKAEKTGRLIGRKAKKVRGQLNKKKAQVQRQATKEIKQLQHQAEKTLKQVSQAQSNLQKTSENIRQRFFVKNGRSLGK